ncbi:MAG TPA: glycoside hydrolase family 15 protein [Myxococcales bacterium]|jgi:GH15 family glucan-1,4-alpha-glucosidase
MAAPRIQDYAALGDCCSAALVSRAGSVDWLCWPCFDSPSVFGALLDPGAGRFSIAPAGLVRSQRHYEPDSNVLVTDLFAGSGAVRLIDAMVLPEAEGRLQPERELARAVECLGGEVDLEIGYDPRPGYAQRAQELEDGGPLGWRTPAGPGLLVLRSSVPLERAPRGGLAARRRLKAGERLELSLSFSHEAPAVLPLLGEQTREALRQTSRQWRDWAGRATYGGPHRDEVVRSALALKLLSFSPSGAIVAAPTTSLPERPGGDLNWDYRYCWLRDASLTVRALFGLGFSEEAHAFVSWLLHATRLTRPRLRVLYDVFGRAEQSRERELPWQGFGGARPVRVGNAAQGQLQLDLYGEVMDAAAHLVRQGKPLDHETCRALVSMGDYVCARWREPDEGIWELRSGRAEHTQSRLLCWVALDRLVWMAEVGELRGAPVERYRKEREAIRGDLEERAWNPQRGSYVAILGGRSLDATALQLANYGLIPPSSRRMRSTWEQLRRELGAPGGLLRRYRIDESAGEGAFGACGFWAVRYLALGGGTLEEAEGLFDDLLGFANDVGLFAEEIEAATGDALGNFPQAFTHVGLINAALALEDRRAAERGRGRGPTAALATEPREGTEARP